MIPQRNPMENLIKPDVAQMWNKFPIVSIPMGMVRRMNSFVLGREREENPLMMGKSPSPARKPE